MLATETPAGAAGILARAAKHYAVHHVPEDALRFLLGLDAHLYTEQGYQSILYDGGLHTKHRHIGYHEFFVGRVQPGESVLDIGCGVGAVAHDLVTKGRARVTGIDSSEQNIAAARKRFDHPGLRFIHGDALSNLPDDHFDVIVLSNVLEHLEQRVEFLQRVVETTSPRCLLIRVPLFEREWRVPLKKELGLEWRLDPTHCTEYTQESFAEEMVGAGLAIVHQEFRWSEIWSELCPRP